jgi:hypothetical protein
LELTSDPVKKRNITILVAAVILVAVCGWGIYIFYHPRIGPRSGRVVDAETGKPIEGAVVVYVWRFSDFLTLPGGIAAFCEIITDKDGKYFIPGRRVKKELVFEGVCPESVVIYKDNYAAYKVYYTYGKPPVGRSFGYPGEQQEYQKQDNLVRLQPWKTGQSHRDHVDYVRRTRNYQNSQLLRQELQKEKERERDEP